jgi:hypothetical protein
VVGDLLRALWWEVGDYTVIPGAPMLLKYGLRAFTGFFAEPLVQYSQR